MDILIVYEELIRRSAFVCYWWHCL